MKQNITAIIEDKKGNVLAIGKNSYIKTHPYQAKLAARVGAPEKVYQHAEIAAIIKLRAHHKPYKMKIFRVNSQGIYRNSAPCEICARAILLSNISIVEHT